MSKLKVNVQHIPSFKEYSLPYNTLVQGIYNLGATLPVGLLDIEYYTTDLEGWGSILYDMTFNSSLYKKEKRDCDWYAFKAKVVCEERYGLNTMGFVIGDTPLGRHAFNLICLPEGFMLFEPNSGFSWAGVFELGEHNYFPEQVIV